MKIKSISLNDVKSYDSRSPLISFQFGVNAIIGENGSGKSTLCEAIGFALFDFLHPYSQADFVREGKKSGRVSVTFESDRSERVYRVERGVGLSKYDVFDVTNKTKISLQSKDEVLSWLKDELGVPSSLDLQTLWKSSLGVPQGKFTNDFAETPSIRAQLFNPLLEVDVYRDLWKQMKNVTNVLVKRKAHVSDQMSRLDSIVEELPSLEKQDELKEKQIMNATQIVENLTAKMKET
ncbi:MAG: AAA family ATPase, partial [Candidatus Thermoplasmatota archaeon]|nr:AAA family ATPase [Candidatus Thermoplasmatota archaeon]